MAKRSFVWAGVAGAVLALGGCGSSSSSSSPAPASCTPPATPTVTFREDVYPILSSQCTPCHSDAQSTLPKFASMDPSTSFTATQGFVDPANAGSSLLVENPTGHNGHPDRITDAQAATITEWIKECAQDNTRQATASTTP